MELEDRLRKILDEKTIVLNLDADTKEEAIVKLADVLYKNDKLISREVYISDVLERENHCTTGIGNGIAIPHGKSEGVKDTGIAVGRLSKPIDWDSLDEKPVSMIFLLSVRSEDAKEEHLRILSSIATVLMEDKVITKLLEAGSSKEIIGLLCG